MEMDSPGVIVEWIGLALKTSQNFPKLLALQDCAGTYLHETAHPLGFLHHQADWLLTANCMPSCPSESLTLHCPALPQPP